MKGQIFIVGAIFVAILLLAMAISIEPVYTNTNYLSDYFENIRTEIIDIVEVSLLSGATYNDDLDNYIDFSEQVLETKGINQRINYQLSGSDLVVDIYLEKGNEYYSDRVLIPIGVYS